VPKNAELEGVMTNGEKDSLQIICKAQEDHIVFLEKEKQFLEGRIVQLEKELELVREWIYTREI
jgi:hypothetical protein